MSNFSSALEQCLQPWLEGDYQAELIDLETQLEQARYDAELIHSSYQQLFEDFFELQHERDQLLIQVASLRRQLRNRAYRAQDREQQVGTVASPIDLTNE